jgi:hypothetical protein
MKPRYSQGASLEAYLVFSTPQLEVTNPIQGCQIERYPENPTHTRAIRVFGDVEAGVALTALRGLLLSGHVRWLEIGMRGYGLMEGKREYRPWRANKHLSLETLTQLAVLEPEVRYHAPV